MKMTVKVVYDGHHVFEVTGSGYDPEGEILHDSEPADEVSLKDAHIAEDRPSTESESFRRGTFPG